MPVSEKAVLTFLVALGLMLFFVGAFVWLSAEGYFGVLEAQRYNPCRGYALLPIIAGVLIFLAVGRVKAQCWLDKK